MAGIFDSPEMLAAFYEEIEEQLQSLEQCILYLENNQEKEETINKLFRVAHTLKGSSAAIGFEKMKILTHNMENLLERIRSQKTIITKRIINALFQCLDLLKLLKEAFMLDRKNINIDITSILNELEKIMNQEPHCDKKELNIMSDNSETEFELDFDCIAQIEQSMLNELNCLICDVRISSESAMKSIRFHLINNYLNELGQVIRTNPDLSEIPENSEINDIKYLIVTSLDAKSLEQKGNNEIMDIEAFRVREFDISKLNRNTEVKANNNENLKEITQASTLENTDRKIGQTVRVNVDKLEKMMNLVGELLIEHTRINQIGNILHGKYTTDNLTDDLLGVSTHVSRIISELQEVVMKTRMLPIQQLFNRFPRMVRDLAESLNKDIELILDGGETEMDRSIIEEMTDPLIHIIRNAIDHGIETPEERINLGKPSKGSLRISAFHQENNVVLTVEDDGKGIDINKVKESAIKKKVITSQDAELMSDSEIINLIFHSGLSTASEVSEVSGRGVGMDIVRNCIDKLNGIIEVETKIGIGTKITIKLPLTLAILTGLLVKINDESYALPMSNVVEIVRKTNEDIEYVKGQAVTTIRDKIIPLICLQDYFNIPRKKKNNKIFVVLLGVAEKRFGLVVDELIGNQEIVVKPLGTYIGKIEGYSGATILGDGSVACILDVSGILKMVGFKKVVQTDKNEII
ncbi:Chemotaxis protein CheA [Caloramator mitchellensis]|uniref:Chemotaxis protein CheA n=1 Tax=Caloramator mitchellensis TaxID=908809 RepID=A0A0R3JQT3_CALMK|nr:chemotaxis protein CheA [Caloramator mitchellensis]KRQ85815.1 Chemotaxis protein CheA [Caloramator mitchellensis]